MVGGQPTSTYVFDAESSQTDSHVDDSSSTEAAAPRWRKSNKEIPESQIKLAQECQKNGFHRVTPWFADLGLFEDQIDFWCWYADVIQRGLSQFGGGGRTHERPGSKYNYYKEDKDGFLARVICQKCRAMIEVKTNGRKLKRADDEALLKFFPLKTIVHDPKVMLR